MENTTARIDGIMKEVQDLAQAQTDELPSMEKKVGIFETQLQSLSSQCTANVNNYIISNIDYLENQNGRNNIIIDGLAKDKAHVSWAETEKQVMDFLINKLNIHSK